MTGFVIGDDGVPGDRDSGRAGDSPARTAVAQIADLAHVVHKVRKVFVIRPGFKHLLDRRIDVDRLADIKGSTAAAHSEQAFQFKVGRGPQRQKEARRAERRANAVTSSVVVVSGKGLATLFRSLGASRIVAGGQSMNPSVEEMLNAVNACKTNEVLIVSNNTNVTPAARQVDGLTEKTVRVVATRNPVEGLAAMVAFAPGVDAETNVDSISDAIETVIGGEVTQAVRDAELETQKIKKGDWLALGPGGIAVVAQDVVSASTQWFEKFVNDEHEIATLCLGVDAKGEDTSRIGEWLSENHPDLEVQVHQGGQPLHAYLLGLE